MEKLPEQTEFLLYQSEDGQIRIETRMQNETVWLTQEQMSLLFDKARSTINEHIKNIFEERELIETQVKYKKARLEEPTEVERHFIEAEEELKQMESSVKGRGEENRD